MLQSGDIIDGYRVESKLGEGGMGIVYLAEQISLQRKVALKLLPPDLATDESYVQKFHREATSAARISHQNIVQVYDVGSTSDEKQLHYLTMEYVDGESLKDMLDSLSKISWQGSVDVLKQSLAGIERAHEAGIIHRDIKPDNIMITRKAEIKVADFGLAKQASGGDSTITMEGVVVGTPYYMSPEQIESGLLTGQTDIYSLGITIWHCVVGRPPFKGDTPMKTALMHLNEPLPHLSQLVEGIPEGYAHIIEKMCEKNPKNRFRSAKEVLESINRFEHGLMHKQGTPDPNPPAGDTGNTSTDTVIRTQSNTRPSLTATRRRRKPHIDEQLFRDLEAKNRPQFGCFLSLLLIAGLSWGAWLIAPHEMKHNALVDVELFWIDVKSKLSDKPRDEVDETMRREYIRESEKMEIEGNIEQALFLLRKAEGIRVSSDTKRRIYDLEARQASKSHDTTPSDN